MIQKIRSLSTDMSLTCYKYVSLLNQTFTAIILHVPNTENPLISCWYLKATPTSVHMHTSQWQKKIKSKNNQADKKKSNNKIPPPQKPRNAQGNKDIS